MSVKLNVVKLISSTQSNLATLLLLSIAMCSCHGQVSTKSDQENTRSLKTTQVPKPKFIDPLFFIEGQLCQHLRQIFEDSKGNLWMGTNVYDLMLYNGDTLSFITEQNSFSGGRVTGIVEDVQGNIWIGSSSGLNKYDGTSFTVFTEEDGLGNNEIWSLHIDKEGVLWIGHNEGLSRFDGESFEDIEVPFPETINPNTIYSENRIVDIVEDKHANLWLGTDGYGVFQYDGNSFENYTTENGLADDVISELLLDAEGNLWVGTYFGGLSKFDGTAFTNYTQIGDINGVEINALYEENDGSVWIGVENNGVYQYDGKQFKHYDQDALSGGSVLSILKDNEERFWFGGWGGLFRLENEVFTPVTKSGPWEK